MSATSGPSTATRRPSTSSVSLKMRPLAMVMPEVSGYSTVAPMMKTLGCVSVIAVRTFCAGCHEVAEVRSTDGHCSASARLSATVSDRAAC